MAQRKTATTRSARGAAPTQERTPAEAFLRALQLLDDEARARGVADEARYFGPTDVLRELQHMGYHIKRAATSSRLAKLHQRGQVNQRPVVGAGVTPGALGYVYALGPADTTDEAKRRMEQALAQSRAVVAAYTPRPRRKVRAGHRQTTLELSDETARLLASVSTAQNEDRHTLADRILAAGLRGIPAAAMHERVLHRYPSTSQPIGASA